MEALLEKEGDVENWNDDRLDELSQRMGNGFKEMREGFTRVDQEMKGGFAQVNREMKAGFEKLATRESVDRVNADLGRFEGRLDRLNWAFIALAVLLIANGIVDNA